MTAKRAMLFCRLTFFLRPIQRSSVAVCRPVKAGRQLALGVVGENEFSVFGPELNAIKRLACDGPH